MKVSTDCEIFNSAITTRRLAGFLFRAQPEMRKCETRGRVYDAEFEREEGHGQLSADLERHALIKIGRQPLHRMRFEDVSKKT